MACSKTGGILVRRTFRSRRGDSATPFTPDRSASAVVSTLGEPLVGSVTQPHSPRAAALRRRAVVHRIDRHLSGHPGKFRAAMHLRAEGAAPKVRAASP